MRADAVVIRQAVTIQETETNQPSADHALTLDLIKNMRADAVVIRQAVTIQETETNQPSADHALSQFYAMTNPNYTSLDLFTTILF
uniref:Amidase n=1 Tax=Rhabditophanes sp. KR3021 TaxID=114890 RepID=A0AC35U196_9BILA